MVKSNLKEEERLAEEIPKLPCLFMTKAMTVIKKKIGKKNAWHEVENTLGYEEGTC